MSLSMPLVTIEPPPLETDQLQACQRLSLSKYHLNNGSPNYGPPGPSIRPATANDSSCLHFRMISALPFNSYWEKSDLSSLNMGNIQNLCVKTGEIDEFDNPKKIAKVPCKNEKEKMLFESMKYEVNRINSFKGKWPLRYVKPDDLAKNGFFYLQSEDRVQCAFCQLILENWNIGDSPLKEHIKNYPKCPYLLTGNAGNILKKNKLETVHKPSFPHELRNINQTSIAIKPKQPNMQDIKHRLLTFKSWPLRMLSPQKLAECGLYYEGVQDVVTCFFCGGSLGNWEVDDDPWREHKAFYPHCAYINIAEKIGYGLPKKSTFTSPLKVPNQPSAEFVAGEPLRSEIIRKASEIFPLTVVQDIVMKRMKEQNRGFASLSELCEEILESNSMSQGYDECGYENKNRKSSENIDTSTCIPTEYIEETSTTSNMEPTKDILLCKICMDRDRAISFQPCGHFVSCRICSERISNCPVCRTTVTSKVRIYMS